LDASFLYFFSILNRRCLLILCANTLNGNFVQGDQSSMFPSKGASHPSEGVGRGVNREEKRGEWPCKVAAFAEQTHFSCDICKSKTNFRSSDSTNPQRTLPAGYASLVVLLFDFRTHSAHCTFSTVFFLLFYFFHFSGRNPCVNMFPKKQKRKKKKARNSKLCVLFNFFSSVL